MALTGRFNLRKTLTGRIVLQVEEEVPGFWGRMTGRTKLHRRWRDANVLDLAAPELRSLVDLRFRPRYMPQTNESRSRNGRRRRDSSRRSRRRRCITRPIRKTGASRPIDGGPTDRGRKQPRGCPLFSA